MFEVFFFPFYSWWSFLFFFFCAIWESTLVNAGWSSHTQVALMMRWPLMIRKWPFWCEKELFMRKWPFCKSGPYAKMAFLMRKWPFLCESGPYAKVARMRKWTFLCESDPYVKVALIRKWSLYLGIFSVLTLQTRGALCVAFRFPSCRCSLMQIVNRVYCKSFLEVIGADTTNWQVWSSLGGGGKCNGINLSIIAYILLPVLGKAIRK